MSRHPIEVTRDDGQRFVLVVGTDHASFKLGRVPHVYGQIYGQGVDVFTGEEDEQACLWWEDFLTPAELVAGLDVNPILRLGEFRGPYADVPPAGGERWLSDYALALFAREIEQMGATTR